MAIMEGERRPRDVYSPLRRGEISIVDSERGCRLLYNEESELWIVEFHVFGHAYDTHRNSFVDRTDAFNFMRRQLNFQDEHQRNLERHRMSMEEWGGDSPPPIITTATQEDSDDSYLERIGA